MKLEELIKDFDSISINDFKNYIIEYLSDLYYTKDSNSKVISKFKNKEMLYEICKSRLYKNGETKNSIKKYI